MNYFNPKNTAERYARGRPNFHSITISRVKDQLNFVDKIGKALDVACGTGLSSSALLDIAKVVYGTDSSEEMLNNAISKELINYSISYAENQPFLNNEFDIITVCSGIHWFDIDKFLIEANRILKNRAHLVIYDNFFISEMKGKVSFDKWFPNVYLKKFPSPKRNNNYNWNNEYLKRSNFELMKEDRFKNEVEFTKEELILYFTTQSNISNAIKRGANYLDIENWLDKELSQFYNDNKVKQTISFGNWIKYLKKLN